MNWGLLVDLFQKVVDFFVEFVPWLIGVIG